MNVTTLLRIAREKRAAFVPLAAGLVINALLAALVVLPLSQRVATAETRQAQSVATLQAAERDQATAASTLRNKQHAERDLATFYGRVLPADMSEARRQTYVSLAQLASDAELQYQRRLEEVQVPRESGQGPQPLLTRLEITMVLRGEYDSVRQFIRDIEASEEFIAIDNVSLVEGSEPGSPLVLTVVLSTYYRTSAHVR
jgi:Tfp pilus assembly protein PilO